MNVIAGLDPAIHGTAHDIGAAVPDEDGRLHSIRSSAACDRRFAMDSPIKSANDVWLEIADQHA